MGIARPRVITNIGVPFGLGGKGRGVEGGPDLLCRSGICRELQRAGHSASFYDLSDDLPSAVFAGLHPQDPKDPEDPKDQVRVHHTKELDLLVAELAWRTGYVLAEGGTPLVLGGDHSIVVGSIGAALRFTESLGVIWIDAHYDAHTEATTHTGNTHGMPLATLLGQGGKRFCKFLNGKALDPLHVIHVGAGQDDCEPEETALLDRLAVPRFGTSFIRAFGNEPVFQAIAKLASSVDRLWVSFDLDVVCEEDAPGVFYRRKKDGLTRAEVIRLAQVIGATGKVIGADIVELNSFRERFDDTDCPITATLAIDVACALLHA
jgi:arginase